MRALILIVTGAFALQTVSCEQCSTWTWNFWNWNFAKSLCAKGSDQEDPANVQVERTLSCPSLVVPGKYIRLKFLLDCSTDAKVIKRCYTLWDDGKVRNGAAAGETIDLGFVGRFQFSSVGRYGRENHFARTGLVCKADSEPETRDT